MHLKRDSTIAEYVTRRSSRRAKGRNAGSSVTKGLVDTKYHGDTASHMETAHLTLGKSGKP